MDSVSGKVACITGAASGVGAATARQFASLGCRLALHDRNGERLKTVAEECRQNGAQQVVTIRGDVRDKKCVDKIHDTVIKTYGTIHILVNNAGSRLFCPARSTSRAGMEEMMAEHVYAPLALSQLFMDQLSTNEGCIVNHACQTGTFPIAGSCAYSAAKAAMISVTKSLAFEMVRSGVRVNSVSPSFIHTDFYTTSKGISKKQNDQCFSCLEPYMASGRCGQADEVASVIVFLASDAASFISGQDIPVSKCDNLTLLNYCSNVNSRKWMGGKMPECLKQKKGNRNDERRFTKSFNGEDDTLKAVNEQRRESKCSITSSEEVQTLLNGDTKSSDNTEDNDVFATFKRLFSKDNTSTKKANVEEKPGAIPNGQNEEPKVADVHKEKEQNSSNRGGKEDASQIINEKDKPAQNVKAQNEDHKILNGDLNNITVANGEANYEKVIGEQDKTTENADEKASSFLSSFMQLLSGDTKASKVPDEKLDHKVT